MTIHLTLASALNLRSGPDSDSAILDALPRFTPVEEIAADAQRRWLNVRAGLQQGWVSNDYLIPEALKAAYPWMARAIDEFGVGEFEDSHEPPDNPRIRSYHDTFGGPAPDRRDSVPWCSSFVNWCLDGRYDTSQVDRSARSWRGWGEALDAPEPGAITVFWRRPDPDEDAEQHGWSKAQLIEHGWNGHVAFLVETVGDQAIVFGGNQSAPANRLGAVNKKAYPLDSDNYGVLAYRMPPG